MSSTVDPDYDRSICATCAAQYTASSLRPYRIGEEGTGDGCPICLDERQYVAPTGQAWTSWRELDGKHATRLEPDGRDPRIVRILTEPKAGAIGQTPFIIPSLDGSLIWDCSPYLSPSGVESILSLTSSSKPLLGMAISHPHFFCSSVTWARKLGCKVYICATDKEWFMRKDSFVDEYYRKNVGIPLTVECIFSPGHFPGSCVLHWDRSMEQSESSLPQTGVIFCSDTCKIAVDRRRMTFMWSYPNYIPLPPKDVQKIWQSLRPFQFGDIYSAWPGEIAFGNGKEKVLNSARRFIEMEGWGKNEYALEE
ncbi:hypothetical protein GLOTRDRAFT_46948 [Gloeophyllum trabeum ATCC 11539]|uniref:Metallo-beta-lactamase domain-containing protein n=1 Tax=Gloeophyllum trabeum (strain ATCC 11539 / FP-39264 / Madison 617) TaxID=670483 RepID=S7PYY6_GLOTA|nr:uncharacterized protein GLOTRDRAFT_46948 [Gloeophyllum trabeum ATCC 11539]EPQ52683.1 hypothetical protein GLOTRDRAFT_46948 [Gloeophyllum trabeum ATCC 11539]